MLELEDVVRDVERTRDKAARAHEDRARFWDEHDDAERADKERELAQKDREGWSWTRSASG